MTGSQGTGGDLVGSDGDYYLENIDRLRETISGLQGVMAKYMEPLMSWDEIKKINEKSWLVFSKLLPEVPFIGGDDNPLTKNLIGAIYEMCFYETMEEAGYEIGQISNIDRNTLRDVTRHKVGIYGLEGMRNFVMDKEEAKIGAERSQKREFDNDWIYEYVEPCDKDSFALGIDYTKCPVVDFFKAHGKERYLPYICANDYPIFKEMGISLLRTQTIGNGAPICDFRFSIQDPQSIEELQDVRQLEEFRNPR